MHRWHFTSSSFSILNCLSFLHHLWGFGGRLSGAMAGYPGQTSRRFAQSLLRPGQKHSPDLRMRKSRCRWVFVLNFCSEHLNRSLLFPRLSSIIFFNKYERWFSVRPDSAPIFTLPSNLRGVICK